MNSIEEGFKCTCKEVVHRNRGQLVTLDWNSDQKGCRGHDFCLNILRFSQADPQSTF